MDDLNAFDPTHVNLRPLHRCVINTPIRVARELIVDRLVDSETHE